MNTPLALVKDHHGTPTCFLNGAPYFYRLMWGSPPTLEGYPLSECARRYAEAGVHLFTFDMGLGDVPPTARENRLAIPSDLLQARFQRLLEADPQALFHLRVHLETPEWWQKQYPEECELASNDKRLCQSFASTLWRAQAKDFLQGLVEQIEQIGLSGRVVAYQCCTGSSGEWVKGPSAMGLICGDYSQPMQTHFQNWLRQQYQGDEIALRRAWNDPAAAFERAAVPGPEAQFRTQKARGTPQSTFRSPASEQPVIDYYRCLAELSAELLIDFCATVKRVTQGRTLAGAFYGYLSELAWNAGFFGEGLDSDYSTYQRSGHLGLWRVLHAPEVDFLVSPYSYGFRGIGGEGCAMPPSESLRLHGKLYLFEDDTRTHITLHDHPNYGKTDTLQESLAILQRNFAYVTTHGQGIWWLAGGSPQTPHIELSQQPAFQPWIQRFQEIGTLALDLDRAPCAEIAVLLDDESMYYQSPENKLDLPLIFQQRLWGLPRLGAPFDLYLLNDFLSGNLKPYKLYFFLNAFRLDQARRAALKRELHREGRAALWVYAPGYLADEASLANMTDLTGLNFGCGEHPWGPLINLVDFDHPITRDLPQDLNWGTNSPLSPVFHVADGGARTLGNVVYAQGRCRPGFVVKEFPEWRSIYSAAPNLPAAVLRGIARYAGVHLYSEAGDVLYATRELLALHSARGGARRIALPAAVEQVYDLFNQRIIASETAQFEATLPPASTALFYTGRRREWGKQ